ncbi:MAG TPA: hypothetical protein VMF65_19650 [Acidimicrobiales bacterium]|nr:hypothetical protein [Acidimicrobiales bacterium]
MDASDFDQNVVHMARAQRGPGPGEPERHLFVPPEVAVALKAARLARALSPAEEAASCYVPSTLILGLEAGHATGFRDEADLLTTVERIATFLGFPPGTSSADILRAWSSAYARQLGGEPDLAEPLAPTQPLPLVSQQGKAAGRSAASSADSVQANRGRSRPSGRGSREPGEPLAPPVKRPARARRALIVASGAAAIVVVGVAVTLALRPPGPHGSDRGHSGSAASSLSSTQSQAAGSPLLKQTSTGAGQATYAVSASSYELTVRSDRPSWVRVGKATGTPQFAGIVTPSTTERLTVGGPVEVQIGAGGTTVTVSSGRSSTTLTPPLAPYIYQLNPQPAGARA